MTGLQVVLKLDKEGHGEDLIPVVLLNQEFGDFLQPPKECMCGLYPQIKVLQKNRAHSSDSNLLTHATELGGRQFDVPQE